MLAVVVPDAGLSDSAPVRMLGTGAGLGGRVEGLGACGHAGAGASAVACSRGASPELLAATAVEASAEPARLSQPSVGYVTEVAVEKRWVRDPGAAWWIPCLRCPSPTFLSATEDVFGDTDLGTRDSCFFLPPLRKRKSPPTHSYTECYCSSLAQHQGPPGSGPFHLSFPGLPHLTAICLCGVGVPCG